ncbi:immune inhibitor A domain-containing protein [Paraglaciecola sp. 25GB23A]|uniref:immune inhibitor A domain-containing protein n=1 Tax=Paraglaciecola sp. 25GB23A TaxID=3156068 RepID=UPI0032AF81A5
MKLKFVTLGTLLMLSATSMMSLAKSDNLYGDLPMKGANTDNPGHPLGDKQNALKLKALQAKLKGKTSGPVKEVAKGQFVELEREGEDSIWTVVAQFGPTTSPYGILQSNVPGPLRNQIPEPDRSVDNTTIWAPDFTPEYYEQLLFSDAPGAISMRNFYLEQSSNRYTVNGEVSDWVQVPFNAAHYGRDYCGGIVCQTTWWFVNDSIDAWYQAQLDEGKTADEINDYLAQFDVWDRYDFDGDGDFNEPDGYIDHFQSVHAGEGQETGGGAQGSDAIWSHRWYAYFSANGPDGAGPNGRGGVKVGGSNYWIGDYTIEPENGGVGVFAHEFGHDLGLPDLYDTSGNTGGAENSVAFWSLYSSGSYGSNGDASAGIGSKPIPMSAYEKIFLGWSNYEVINYGQSASLKMGPATDNTKQAQQLVLLLPDKEVVTQVGGPFAGSYFYYSGSGNNLDNAMSRNVTLPAGAPMLSAKVKVAIELNWDYAYLTVNGNAVATNLSTNTNPYGQNFGNGITGSSGGAWLDLTADLSAYAGQTVTIGFRYWTDTAAIEEGLFVDNIAIDGSALDDAESDAGWIYSGFTRTTGTVSEYFFNAYFAEYRTYRGYDDGLRTGPYNFGFTDDPALGNWVEHFPYQDGLLIWYYDTSFANNNIGDHCLAGNCGGLVLPVDAHPELLLRPDNAKAWRPRVQSYDSTFGLDKTDVVCLHLYSIEQCYGGLPAVKKFDDTQSYWIAPDASLNHYGWSSVQVPNTGTTIEVKSISAKGNFMQVHVNK